MRAVESVKSIFGLHVKSVDVIQIAVPSLGHNRQRPRIAVFIGAMMLQAPGDHRIPYDADAVRIRDHHWALEKTRLFNQGIRCARSQRALFS
jgi:hypothetical protein